MPKKTTFIVIGLVLLAVAIGFTLLLLFWEPPTEILLPGPVRTPDIPTDPGGPTPPLPGPIMTPHIPNPFNPIH